MRFEEFAAARLPALLRYATVLSGDPELARDLVQEALTRAFVHWGRVSGAEHPYAYVRAILTNEYLSVRRRRTLPTHPLTWEEPPAEADHAVDSDRKVDLRRAVLALPPNQRAVIVLRYYEGLRDEEIAETLACRPATVRSHAHRAFAALRLNLHDLAGEGSLT